MSVQCSTRVCWHHGVGNVAAAADDADDYDDDGDDDHDDGFRS